MNAGKYISVCLGLGRSEDSTASSGTGLWIAVSHYVWVQESKQSLLQEQQVLLTTEQSPILYTPFLAVVIISLGLWTEHS